MVDQNAIASRLSALNRYCERLAGFRQLSREEFLADEDVYQLAERYLHLVCESMLDIAQHVISDVGFRQPEDYKDTMEVLREEAILDDKLAARLKEWMGFRNVLVHLYLRIDHNRSYDAIQESLEDPRSFAERMAERFL